MENTEKKQEVVKEPVVEEKTTAVIKGRGVRKPKSEVVIKNTSGEEVKISDYFYGDVLPSGFEGTCGKPVDREDLLSVFNKVFKPKDNILFYKQVDREVYLVIVPLKYSTEVGAEHDSVDGDFHKHAMSFINEGSVNLDTLRQKLERINKFVNYKDR